MWEHLLDLVICQMVHKAKFKITFLSCAQSIYITKLYKFQVLIIVQH